MNRRQFIESQGATCRNWQWSWSFINDAQRFIIFGAWDRNTQGNRSEIFSESWQFNHQGKRNSGYKQSREHIRLIEEEAFDLYTFPMKYSDSRKDESGDGPAKLDGFEPILSRRRLIRVGQSWYASDGSPITRMAEEVDEEVYHEGACKTVTVNSYERNAKARLACLNHHGYRCQACGLLFEEFYGDLGEGFIHVHHITPVSEVLEEYEIDPVTDLAPVCPNCHAMIHTTRPPLSIEQLKAKIATNQKRTSGLL